MKRLFLAIFASVLLASCSASPQTAVPTPTNTPEHTILIETADVSIRFPESYIGGTTEDLEALKDKLNAMGGSYANVVDTLSDNTDQYLIYAYDTKPTTSGFLTNFNLVVMQQPDSSTLESQLQSVYDSYDQAGGTDMESKPCSHGEHECIEFKVTLTQQGQSMRFVQYLVRNGKDVYILTYVTDTDDFPKLYDEFSQSFSTFQIKENS